MLAAVQRGEVQVVVVPAVDRLGRSALHVLSLEETIRKNGAALVSLRGEVDTTTPSGTAMFQMTAVMAQLERSLISQRTKTALAHLKAQGIKLGKARKSSTTDEQIRELKRANPTWGSRRLARMTGLSPMTVWRALNQPTL